METMAKNTNNDLIRQAASAFGSLGGKARSNNLTPEEKSESAAHASRVRWANYTEAERAAVIERSRKARWGRKKKPILTLDDEAKIRLDADRNRKKRKE